MNKGQYIERLYVTYLVYSKEVDMTGSTRLAGRFARRHITVNYGINGFVDEVSGGCVMIFVHVCFSYRALYGGWCSISVNKGDREKSWEVGSRPPRLAQCVVC